MRARRAAGHHAHMSDVVGSLGVARKPRRGPLTAGSEPQSSRLSEAAVAGDRPSLTWQTTIGQIVFLQSVIHEPATGALGSTATRVVWHGGKRDGAQRR
jgi:hypothetical protein